MNSQERDLLTQFLNQLAAAPSLPRDPEAEALISQAVGSRGDAAYLLVQRTLLLEQALKAAQEKITQIEQQARQAPAASGFLQGAASAWGNSAVPFAAPSPLPAASSAIPGMAGVRPPAAPAPAPGAFTPSAGPSFLGTMAAGAAGAIGGALLLQGIEGMWHHGSAAGLASGQPGLGLSSPGMNPGGETVINNYYGGEPAPDDAAQSYDSLAQEDAAVDDGGDSDWA